ncbi:MAG TPA: NAD(P)/FAD-dependent oxidoreductase, partial [Oligoflexia bacterium]|nr:NAD(P)/FAD-dependent oxidoreductase [Oligoflexia bacterium]
MTAKNYNKTSVLIVGAGAAGLACAIAAKKANPGLDICVIDKGPDLGNHSLSGAVLEPEAAHRILALVKDNWQEDEGVKEVLARKVERDDVLFLPGKSWSLNLTPLIRAASALNLGPGQMRHDGDYIVSISKLTKWLGQQAKSLGVEVLCGFAAEDIRLGVNGKCAAGVKLVDCGLDKEGHKQPNYSPGELIEADIVVLAEGCDGLLTERFIEKAGLKRQTNQLYSVGVKELIKVSDEQYRLFGDNRVVHALGYPIWTPVAGPGIFGGGLMYSYGNNCITVGMIVGLDWRENDFNPQDALTHFKNHAFVKQFIDGGKVIEAGAKMIPEGGFYAIPRDRESNAIGCGNVIILGDSAGFVNMLKIKGLHNALDSGRIAGEAVAKTAANPAGAALAYTEILEQSAVIKEMRQARKYRQVIAKFGNFAGLPLSVFANMLPLFETEPDYKAMRRV